jgi:maltose alpha-D-glucosyltransferase/alpha-amylase
VLTSFVPGCHDAWEDTLGSLHEFYKRVEKLPWGAKNPPSTADAAAPMLGHERLPRKPADLIGGYLEDAKTLGERTASLHLTLSSDPNDPAFKPEPWTMEAQQNLFAAMEALTKRNFELLRKRLPTFPPDAQAMAQKVLPLELSVLERFKRLTGLKMEASRIRMHGDYHLGQLLHHGSDFLIIDFEGEPAVAMEERRAKQSAMRDVAGMIYSFFYAANAALRELPGGKRTDNEMNNLTAWARYWSVWAGAAFLRSYLQKARPAFFVPADEASLKIMLDVELLRKATYELGYELNNRPDWVKMAFQVLMDLLDPENPI